MCIKKRQKWIPHHMKVFWSNLMKMLCPEHSYLMTEAFHSSFKFTFVYFILGELKSLMESIKISIIDKQ